MGQQAGAGGRPGCAAQAVGVRSAAGAAVHATYVEQVYHSEEAWKWAVEHSDVRMQWDPDHDPVGAKVERRAIQLGLRGEMLAQYAREWLISIEDISAFVRDQYQYVQGHDYAQLTTPRELVYPVADPVVAARLGIIVS